MPSPLMLERLLGAVPVSSFLTDHWLQRPLWGRGSAAQFADLTGWARLERLIASTECDVLCARDGRVHPDGRPSSAQEARARMAEGYTLALRQPDHHDDAIAEVGRAFAVELFGQLNLHIYLSPPGHGSFGWHCDPEEVFILQTHGKKSYALRENTVSPHPLPETLRDADIRQERSEQFEVELAAGDWLYIPGGWWHTVNALEEATSLSVGLLPPSPVALLDLLRQDLLRSPEGRRRLPPLGRASPAPDAQKLEECAAALRDLGDYLHARSRDPATVLRFLAGYGVTGIGRRR